MSINSLCLLFNMPRDQIKYLAELQGVTLKEDDDEKLEPPKAWKFSGFYPFISPYLPFNIAIHYNIKIHNFRNDVVGLILPYPHGFDRDPLMGVTRLNVKFLHLFNIGDNHKRISGIMEGIEFKKIEVPCKKRVILALC